MKYFSHFLLRFVAACLFTLIVLFMGASLFLMLAPKEEIARDQLIAFLRRYDIHLTFDIASITHKHIIFQNVALLPEQAVTAREITISYDITRLLDMEVDDITITEPQIHWKKTDKGYTLPGLERYLHKEAEAVREEAAYAAPTLPFHSLTVTDGATTLPLDENRSVSASFAGKLTQGLTGHISLHNASFPLPNGERLVLPKASIERPENNASFTLKIEKLYHDTKDKPWFAPLFLNGKMDMDINAGTFEGKSVITSLFPQLHTEITVEGSFSPFTFRLNAEQPSLIFATGILQPDNLFPILRGYAEQVSGSVAVKGALAMEQGGKLESHATLTMKELSGTLSKVAVERINGTLRFDSLFPLAATKRQNLSVDGILLGLPLYNGQLSFSLAKDGTLTFHGNKWQWAGGYVHTTGLTSNIYDFKPPRTTLYAKNVDVADLLSGLLKQGISAEGTVSGELPVSFTEDAKIMITNGVLSADGPGRIAYAPTENSPLHTGQSFQTDLLLQAVKNFHYDAFSLRLNSENPHYMTIAMHLAGRNPENFNGQRVELNVNLNGDLIDILLSSMDIYSLPTRLQEQINQ